MLLLGNLAAFVGCTIMVLTGLIKEKKKVLVGQCVQFSFMALGNILLGAVSGCVSNVIGFFRNLVFARTSGSRGLKIVFIVVQLILTWLTWNGSAMECLPILATVAFTWCLDTKSDILFKGVNGGGQILWAIYDFYYCNYAGFAFDILSVVSNLIGIILIRRDRKKARGGDNSDS